MATAATSPSSPLRPEDLLSDSSEPPGLNQVSSEVTSQLYTSLHLNRQAEATARAQLYLASTSSPPNEGLDSLAQELSRSLSVGLENNLKKKDGSKHIFEMESVRGQLQTMLHTSRDTTYRDPLIPGTGSERREEDSFDSDSTATLLNTRPLQDLSPSSSAQALEELFPRYTSLRPGAPANPPDFQGLRDALDSELTRRKHCERHIQSLQTRVLELQQQLAVAVAADRKKDIMIEQLDKTLARVVEGWNRHEAERTEVLRGLQEERQAAELTRSKQQEAVTRLEQSLSEAMEALTREQEGTRLQQREREALEEERQALTLRLEVEQQQCRALQEERDEARAGQLNEHCKLEALQVALEEERQAWTQQEHQLKKHLQALQEEGQAQLEREKARYESQRIQMESELAVQLEQRVTERLAEAQENSLRQAASLRDHHRKQLQELSGQHQQELATQLAQFKVEMAEREERQQQVAQDYELRLAREQARVRDLKSGNQQLEEQRVELVERLQAMLQAHWDEVNQLLSTTLLPPNPQAPPAEPSSPGALEPEKGERRLWAMPPMAVALKPVLQQSREVRDDLPGASSVLRSASPDLSLLLGPSFQSQSSFQPLEPKPDLAPPTAGPFSVLEAFTADHRAERPFPEEDPGSDGDGSLKPGLPPASQLEGLKNFLQQLLETVPQSSENPSVDLLPPKSDSRTVSSWEEAPQVPRLPPAVHKTKVPLAMASSLFRAHELPSSHLQGSGLSTGSPERGTDGLSSSRQLMEVSELLRLYQARGWGALPAEDLLLYLKRLEHGGTSAFPSEHSSFCTELYGLGGSIFTHIPDLCGRTDGQGELIPRRNTDSRLGEIPRKEIPSQAVPRRLASAPKTEKPARKKSGHPAPSSMRSRGGIWR
ncbi:centrobin isoform X7 [Cricetulus griseus]|uniref:Centrobin isoform X7 n=1 Tax=Cricetulus griseus TaxID=10029 RepID=A0A9J7KBB9_CRIGR|nr:centrobin isoform X7 [Cricetulus griseus]